MRRSEFKQANALRALARIIPSLILFFGVSSAIADADRSSSFGSSSIRPAVTADWLQAGFDSAHTGYNRFETEINRANVPNLTELWASPVGGLIYASPVVFEGKVYIGGGDGHMYAFDAETGATLWVGPQQPLFFVDSAAAGHGLVLASSVYSTFLAYNAESGEIAWTSDLDVVRASPTLNGRKLYVGSFEGALSALDAETGTTIWSSEERCCIFDQAPVVDGDRVFQVRTDGTLTAYNAQNGKELWRVPAFTVGTVAAAYGMLFFNYPPNVVALAQTTGAQIWTAPVFTSASTSPPAVAKGLVFVTSSALTALDAATGAVVWTAAASSSWGPSVANGVVYASNLNGEWDAFDARDGSLLWSVITGSGCGGNCIDALPVVANGRLYLAGGDGVLRAYGLPR